MERYVFSIQGSDDDPYSVTFVRGPNGFRATCTCPAGESRMACKHRLRILRNDTEGLVSSNAHEVAIVSTWLPGSLVQAALDDLARAEADQEAAKRRVSAAKKAVAEAFYSEG